MAAPKPWETAFSLDFAFPSGVRGPVDFCELARLAAIWALVAMRALLLVFWVGSQRDGDVRTQQSRSGLYIADEIAKTFSTDWKLLIVKEIEVVTRKFANSG